MTLSRRKRYADSTRTALIDAAELQFTEHGYAGTSLDAIVAGADLTKGALYHHFSGKQAVFEAVFERVEAQAAEAIARAAEEHQDPWQRAQAGLRAFLEAVQQPGYRRVVIIDGPSVLGHERLREQEERSTYAIVLEIARSVLASGTWDPGEALLDIIARILFGALSAAGGAVATSADGATAATRAEAAVDFIMAGLQALIEQGAVLPDPGPAADRS